MPTSSLSSTQFLLNTNVNLLRVINLSFPTVADFIHSFMLLKNRIQWLFVCFFCLLFNDLRNCDCYYDAALISVFRFWILKMSSS